MQKLIAITQMKCYNTYDFDMWLKWYCKFIKCDKIFIINDSSLFDIYKVVSEFKYREKINTDIEIIEAKEFDKFKNGEWRQTRNYTLALERIKPNQFDIIFTPDDDEFWWYDTSKYESFIDACNDEFYNKRTMCFTIPWILMSSNTILEKRNTNFADCFKYRANLKYAERKPIFLYTNSQKHMIDQHYGFANHSVNSTGELRPNEPLKHFAKVDYNYHIRCYHYRLTTIEEYAKKMYTDISYYDRNKQKLRIYASKTLKEFSQKMYGEKHDYSIKDLTICNELEKL